MLLAACGGSGGSTAASTASSPAAATATSTSGGEVATLTNAATSAVTYVRVGATVEVVLTADPAYRFTVPASADPAVLRTESSAATSTGAAAQFRALTPGTARLRATENPNCLPQCGLPSRLWEATVVVTPHPVP